MERIETLAESGITLFFFRAWFYCKACHEDIKDETLIKKCKCKNCKIIFFTFKQKLNIYHDINSLSSVKIIGSDVLRK